MTRAWTAVVAALVVGSVCGVGRSGEGAKLVEVRKVWSEAAHNAFTDLSHFRGRWFCTFREGAGHVSHDGAVRVLSSVDGLKWRSAALLKSPAPAVPDLRDPKLSLAPDGRLMLTAAGANRRPNAQALTTFAWFTKTGDRWGEPVRIGEDGFWLWRVTWHGSAAYAVGYNRQWTRLYHSKDGKQFDVRVARLFQEGYPNEASLAFGPGGTAYCLLRRDGRPSSAMLGTARPPYTKWAWKDLGVRLGGPKLLRLADGRFLVGGRRYDGGARTSLMRLDAQRGKLAELLRLPSGGDTSYPGMVWRDGLLWMSYYASHEGKSSIYLAKVELPTSPATP